MNPDSGVYAIGSPVVSEAVIHLDGKQYQGHTFTVTAENNSAENIYIQSATLNGQPLTKAWLTYEQIIAGGSLALVMGPKPNPDWGSAPADRPPATMPADFKYADLPTPASTNLIALPFPIRIICGSDEAAGDFVPDPNAVAGSMNHADTKIDTSAPNAAPAAVYQSEFYGSDFTYSLPVPKDGPFTVRLHFAEIFDRGAGDRLENIAINDKPVLTDFDICGTAGTNKAVVKEFPAISPDANGNIVIHVASSPNSPDHNAKINGIEIFK
jgi:hypothetical protein